MRAGGGTADDCVVADRDPNDWWQRAYDLHGRGGHQAEAEAAYRQAIAGGLTEVWLGLGILLSTQPGRERDEEAAFRAAMASENLDTAARAALHLGDLMILVYDDRSAARACFEFAEKHGARDVAFPATHRLAHLLAYEGDREAALDRTRSYAIWFGDERNRDMSGEGVSTLSMWVKVASGRYTREPFRRFVNFRGRAMRRRRSVVARSERLTSWSNRISKLRSRLAERFWAEDEE